MRCARSRRLLGLGLDGRLTPADAARLEAHLASCEDCRAERATVAGMWDRLGALGAGPAPREDWPAIQVRIAERVQRRPWLQWSLPVRRGLAMAALSALAAVGIAAGDAVAHAALRPDRAPPSVEAVAIAEGFGVIPFGGPSPGLLLGGGRR